MLDTRVCSKCKNEKSLSDFYFRKSRQQYETQCKSCRAAQFSEAEKSPEKRAARSALRKIARRSEINRARERRNSAAFRAKYPQKAAAKRAVRSAIERGEMARPDACQVCGATARRQDGITAVQAHHPDYSRPLDVIWLCPWCHAKAHANERALAGEGQR